MKDLRFIFDNTDDCQEYKEFRKKGKAYNQEFIEIVANKKTYDAYQERHKKNDGKKAPWKRFKKDLLKFSDYRCPICEREINNYDDIEHFRPKGHYWWFAYDYRNYYIICDLCNTTYKGKQFPLLDEKTKVDFDSKDRIKNEKPLLFNPCLDNPLELFELEFKLDVSNREVLIIHPLSSLDQNSYFYRKAQKTIEIYNLNNSNNQDGSRFANMIDKCADLIDLAKSKIQYEKDNSEQNKKEFLKNIKRLEKKKLGFTSFVLNGQFKDNTL